MEVKSFEVATVTRTTPAAAQVAALAPWQVKALGVIAQTRGADGARLVTFVEHALAQPGEVHGR